MATLLAHIQVRKGQAKAFEDTIAALHEATHRLEPGCRRYEYARGQAPNFYYCMLSFDDFIAFLEHQTSDHHEAPEFGTFIETIRLEWLDPVQSASELVSTRPADLPEEASALMKTYAEKFAITMPQWWSAPD